MLACGIMCSFLANNLDDMLASDDTTCFIDVAGDTCVADSAVGTLVYRRFVVTDTSLVTT